MPDPDEPAAGVGGLASDGRRGRSAAADPDVARTGPDAKAGLRRELLAQRARHHPDADVSLTDALAAVLLAAPEVASLGPEDRLAAYLPLPGEPSPVGVVAVLAARGVEVVAPVLLDDGDLDWSVWHPGGGTRAGPVGTRHPAGHRLGVGAVAGARVVLVPGVAGDRGGHRLGRGGGSYDRALDRVDAARSWTCLLLWPDELVDRVPTEAHDRSVDAVATAAGLVRAAGSATPVGR